VLDALRRSLEACRDDSPAWRLAWLTLVAALRPAARANTAPWQYVLPRKQKRRVPDALEAFDAVAGAVEEDLASAEGITRPPASILLGDARACDGVPDGSVTLVLTSPPYPNNYDYADATRLEMTFLGEVGGWGDLQAAVRRRLLCSCTQHVPAGSVDLDAVLSGPEVGPVRTGLAEVCRELARVRLEKGGRKTYHLMVACYVRDLARVWIALRRVCARPSSVCFVVGDSAPYGVHVPVFRWLSALAEAAGFSSPRFEKTRDRNGRWRNRKHRVPLAEGRLWLDG
jgi:hypothetical protein